jgi:hypothetical protein
MRSEAIWFAIWSACLFTTLIVLPSSGPQGLWRRLSNRYSWFDDLWSIACAFLTALTLVSAVRLLFTVLARLWTA